MKKQELEILFITALTDAFKDEDDRELCTMPNVDLENADGNDLVLAMLHAFHFVINTFTGQHSDPLEFIGMLVRLLFQEERERLLETGDKEEEHENTNSDE